MLVRQIICTPATGGSFSPPSMGPVPLDEKAPTAAMPLLQPAFAQAFTAASDFNIVTTASGVVLSLGLEYPLFRTLLFLLLGAAVTAPGVVVPLGLACPLFNMLLLFVVVST